jgi:hypothetical protein
VVWGSPGAERRSSEGTVSAPFRRCDAASCTKLYLYASLVVWIYVYMYFHIYIHMYIYIYTYMYIYMYDSGSKVEGKGVFREVA